MVSVESEKSELGLDKSRGVFSRRSVSDHWKFGVGSRFFGRNSQRKTRKQCFQNTQDKVWQHIIELCLLSHIGLFSWVVFLNSDPWLFAFCSCCYKSSKDSSNVAVEPETDTLELLLVPLRPETL